MLNWKIDFYVGLTFLLISMTVFAIALTYPRLAAMFPAVISLTLSGLSLLLMISAIRRKNNTAPDSRIDHNISIVSKIVIGIVVYILIIKWIGYILSTFLLIAYTVMALGYPKIKQLLIVSGITTIILFLIFEYLVKTPLPEMGIVELFNR